MSSEAESWEVIIPTYTTECSSQGCMQGVHTGCIRVLSSRRTGECVPVGGSRSCETRVGVAVALVDATVAGSCVAAACCPRAVLICEAKSAVCAEQKLPHMSSSAATTSRTCVLAILPLGGTP